MTRTTDKQASARARRAGLIVATMLAACGSLRSHAAVDPSPSEPASTTPATPDGARLIHVPESTAAASVWTERGPEGVDVPMFSVTLDGHTFTEARATDNRLMFRTGAFDPLAEPAPVANALKAKTPGDVIIVQFHTPAIEAYVADIEKLGGKVWQYLPYNAYIVRIGDTGRKALAARDYVRWIGEYEPGYKLDPACQTTVLQGNLEAAPAVRYNVMVFERGPLQKSAVSSRVRELGGTIEAADAGGRVMIVSLTPSQLGELAQLDEVMYIDPTGGISSDGDNEGIGNDMDLMRQANGAVYVQDTLGYTGQGVRMELADDNIRNTHVDFQLHPVIFHTSRSGPTQHGTNMFGAMFGSGTGNPLAKGMMPEGQGFFADQSLVDVNRYTLTQELLSAPYFAVLQSNSWGGDQVTTYTSRSALMDDILFDMNIVITNSMSNLGNQQCRPEAWAKNIISVGAVLHRDTLTRVDDCWCGLGSIGPASDGRIKPDVSNYGDFIFVPDDASDTAYINSCCTSIATAATSGALGLFHQIWHSGIFGNSPGGTVFESRPQNTLPKALLINTANQWTYSGLGQDLGRMHQGWGQPSLKDLVETSKVLIINESQLLAPLETHTWNVTVNTGDSFLKATMVYSDPAAVPLAAIHRVNNLSLRLNGPDGSIYWGNNGLTLGNWSSAGGSEDSLNTVENVFVQNPAVGTWQVTVIASEINEDGHIETPALDADFSLVVTKPAQQEPAPGFDMTWYTIDGGGSTSMTGNNFEMGSTLGQPDARRLSSAEFSLAGGFWGAEQGPGCPGDANGDGITNGADLSVLLGQFGSAVSPGTGADFNSDGAVNGADLSVLLSNFGCPS